jgi:hypothetical protein
MSLLFDNTQFDKRRPIPTSDSVDKDEALYANVPPDDEPDAATDANAPTTQEVSEEQHTPPLPQPQPASASIISPQKAQDDQQDYQQHRIQQDQPDSNVYLQIARVLFALVILLSVVYLIYWILQNIYDIDPIESINKWVSTSSLSNLSKPLNELTASVATAGATTAIATNTALSTTETPQQQPSSLLSQPSENENENENNKSSTTTEQPRTPTIVSSNPPNSNPTNSTWSSMFAPLSNLFRQSESNLAPHKDGVSDHNMVQPQMTPLQGPLTSDGMQMKRTLSDKSVSVLLDLMAKIN